jgi:hypothetical protein
VEIALLGLVIDQVCRSVAARSVMNHFLAVVCRGFGAGSAELLIGTGTPLGGLCGVMIDSEGVERGVTFVTSLIP